MSVLIVAVADAGWLMVLCDTYQLLLSLLGMAVLHGCAPWLCSMAVLHVHLKV